LKNNILMISVNNTLNPKTGGEYVYKVIKSALAEARYRVYELSVPLMLMKVAGKEKKRAEVILRAMAHVKCMFKSFWERYINRFLIITSSSPLFPVAGHLVYHQPKAGMQIKNLRPYMTFYERMGFTILENEWLSPFWFFAKRSHPIHLSNSFFTKRLIKEIYDLDSEVLYPPVPIRPFKGFDRCRDFAVIVGKPKVLSGIIFLPEIVTRLPKKVSFIVIGKADYTGLRIIRSLSKQGFNIRYLGYVSELVKLELFRRYSHYLHLGLNEPFGIMVVEAMANGCIPIAPKSGGIPEYLPENLLYSSCEEAVEKISSKIGFRNHDLMLELRKIAENFREEIFRRKIVSYIRALETFL